MKETKRTYEQPQAEVIEIELQHVLCSSGDEFDDGEGGMGGQEGEGL